MQPAVGQEMQYVTQLVASGKIEDDTDVEDYLMSISGYPRFNPTLVPHGRTVPEYQELTTNEGHFHKNGVATKLPYVHPAEAQVGGQSSSLPPTYPHSPPLC